MEQLGTAVTDDQAEPQTPRAPIIVLGKADDFLEAGFTASTAVDAVKRRLDPDGVSDPAAVKVGDFDFFDAAGRRLEWIDELDALAVADERDHGTHVRRRVARVFLAMEPALREDPQLDLSPLDLPYADISFELFAWRLAATLSDDAAEANGRGDVLGTQEGRLGRKFSRARGR